MEGSAAPLGAERRRLAPLTGPTVWGSATPRRSSPLSKGGRVRPRRGGRTQPPYLCASEDFHSPRSPDLAAPPPPRVKIPARPGRANRKSAAERRPPHPPSGSGGAGGDGGQGGQAREKRGLASLEPRGRVGTGSVPAAHPRVAPASAARAGRPRRRSAKG